MSTSAPELTIRAIVHPPDKINGTPRKQRRMRYLDASVQHVENALLARAAALEGIGDGQPEPSVIRTVLLAIAGEYRDLAEELHYW